MDFEVAEGYEIEETNEVFDSKTAYGYTHFLRLFAQSHANHLNAQRIDPMYRYIVEPISSEMRHQMRLSRLERWAVVPYRNVLRKKAYEPLEYTKTY